MEIQMKTPLVQHAISFLLIISGVLIIAKIRQQDWMTEEADIKFNSFKNVLRVVKNMTSASGMGNSIGTMFDGIPDKAQIELKTHFGLKKTCNIIKFTGFNNPEQLYLPEMTWCNNNDVFTNPEKYNLDKKYVATMHDEANGIIIFFLVFSLEYPV